MEMLQEFEKMTPSRENCGKNLQFLCFYAYNSAPESRVITTLLNTYRSGEFRRIATLEFKSRLDFCSFAVGMQNNQWDDHKLGLTNPFHPLYKQMHGSFQG